MHFWRLLSFVAGGRGIWTDIACGFSDCWERFGGRHSGENAAEEGRSESQCDGVEEGCWTFTFIEETKKFADQFSVWQTPIKSLQNKPKVIISNNLSTRNVDRMYGETATPQVITPSPALIAVSPPPPLYTAPNPQTLVEFLFNLFQLLIHALLAPFSSRLIPCHPNQRYAINLSSPAAPVSQAIVPLRRERRSRSKSPSRSPSSVTLTEGTLDGERVRRTGVKTGFGVDKIRIRGGRRRDHVVSKQEGWAKEAFGLK